MEHCAPAAGVDVGPCGAAPCRFPGNEAGLSRQRCYRNNKSTWEEFAFIRGFEKSYGRDT